MNEIRIEEETKEPISSWDAEDNVMSPSTKIQSNKYNLDDTQDEIYPRILVVDDDHMNIEVITAMLSSKHVKADSALNGNQALALIQTRMALAYQGKTTMYKIILLDYSMPEMDGPQVATEIRRIFQNSVLLDSS